MQIRLLDIAQIELDEAIEYYNYKSTGLGDSFLLEVLNSIRITPPDSSAPPALATKIIDYRYI